MLRWAVWDLDGTLTETDWRNHLAVARNWEEFHAGIPCDQPRPTEVALLKAWCCGDAREHNRVAIITGRNEQYRAATEEWLSRHGIHFDALYMRGFCDRRPDTEVKAEAYEQMLAEGKTNIVFVVEDRDCVVEMWRSKGLTCLQFQTGAY